ncbi:MAG TPA: helix-turn-helix domain-containing protein [Solirubrobacterales bacterium]|nr:helix-turn-helix domain-containing protein [Solirubrobacterales bacterium]
MPGSLAVSARDLTLVERLRERRPEIERAISARVQSVGEPAELEDPTYVEGLRAAIVAAVDYAFAGVEKADPEPGPVPLELLAQARAAAQVGVPLETVLRRYLAGHSVLDDFLIRESEAHGSMRRNELQGLLRVQAALVDSVIAAICEEYRDEIDRRSRTLDRRRATCVERLLAGELLDASELSYDLDAHHLGAIAVGPQASPALRGLAGALDRRLLLIHRDAGLTWAWLGGGQPLAGELLERVVASRWPAKHVLALGEPARGLDGWRLTHHQAAVVVPVARREGKAGVRYAHVALLAAALQDEVLRTSLRSIYLTPLAVDRDGGKILRETLNAYFAAARNVSSAAAALSVTRKTVNARLRVVEQRLGRPIHACAADLEIALRMQALLDSAATQTA